MTKMAAMPLKPFKNLLLRKDNANGSGACYAAFGTWAQ